jgi:glutathione synthase/RimK-type ligase-like ATP-grasp enzyme
LATCAELAVPDPDRPVLDAALDDAGVRAEWAVWDDPSVDWSRFDAVWIRSTWDYTAHHAAFLAWVDDVAAATELWNPASIVRWNSHKSYLLDLEAAGVAVVPTVVVPEQAPLALGAVLAEHGWDEAVVKPAVSVGAIGAARVTAADAAAWSRPPDATGDLLVQPLVPEVTAGETSMIAVEGTITHSVRKIPAAGDFRVQVKHGGREVAHMAGPDELELARRALDAVGERLLYARVDCVTTPAGPRLMELELIEPFLFLGTASIPAVAELARAVATRLQRPSAGGAAQPGR